MPTAKTKIPKELEELMAEMGKKDRLRRHFLTPSDIKVISKIASRAELEINIQVQFEALMHLLEVRRLNKAADYRTIRLIRNNLQLLMSMLRLLFTLACNECTNKRDTLKRYQLSKVLNADAYKNDQKTKNTVRQIRQRYHEEMKNLPIISAGIMSALKMGEREKRLRQEQIKRAKRAKSNNNKTKKQ